MVNALTRYSSLCLVLVMSGITPSSSILVPQSKHLNVGSSSLEPEISTRYSRPMIPDSEYESSLDLITDSAKDESSSPGGAGSVSENYFIIISTNVIYNFICLLL